MPAKSKRSRPIRLRYTGDVIDLTTAYDDQDIMHTEPVEWSELSSTPRSAAPS